MIFGDHVRVPASSAAAAWIGEACRGEWGTVGALVPNDYALHARVRAPSADHDDWWGEYRSLFAAVAAVGERHTSSSELAWFAVWDGHGWDTSTTHVAVPGPLDEAGFRRLRATQARLREEDARRHAAVRAGLAAVPRFHVPHRTYHLLAGPVAAVVAIEEPGSPGRWQRPDLFWPNDRSWFVASDVDFWSLYVGGSERFVTELVEAVPTPAEVVTLDRRLEVED